MTDRFAALDFGSIDPTLRCDSCGYEGPTSVGFVRRPGGGRVECPGCLKRRGVSNQRGWLIATFVLLVVSLALTAVLGGSVSAQLGLWSLWLGLVVVITVLHEAGHALVAWILRFRVFAVNIGVGPALFDFRVGDTVVSVKALPLAGSTHPATPSRRAFRLRWFLVSSAGLAVNVLLFLAVFWWQPESDLLRTAREAFLWADGLIVLTNLWPARVTTAAGMSSTDGLLMLKAPRLTRTEVDEYLAAYDALDALHPRATADGTALSEEARVRALDGAPPSVRGTLAVRLIEEGRPELATVALRGVVDDRGATARSRAIALNNLAWAQVLAGDPGTLAEADRASAEAYALMPWERAIQGTRGSVLVALGRSAEAAPFLEGSLAGDLRPADRAVNTAFLALAAVQRGDIFRGRQLLAQAGELDSGCRVLPRVEQALTEAEVASVLGYWRANPLDDESALHNLHADHGSSTARLADALGRFLAADTSPAEKSAFIRRRLFGREFASDDDALAWLRGVQRSLAGAAPPPRLI